MMIASSADAQWSNIAPNVFQPNITNSGGAMHFCSGVLWGGWRNVKVSFDTGKTWSTVIATLSPSTDYVLSINFHDAQRGVIRTTSKLYITTNQGATWTVIASPGNQGRYAIFSGANTIISCARDGIYVSNDLGTTWNRTFIGINPSFVVHRGFGHIACFDGTRIVISNDNGQTWSVKSNHTPLNDTYTIGYDMCDTNRIYVANEDYFARFQNFSEIITTPDEGNTYSTLITRPLGHFNGAMGVSRDAIFFQTINNGIYRSTDRGNSLDSIGGPGCGPDTRMLVVLDNMHILGVDASGSVWYTQNSGGYPIVLPPPLLLPPLPVSINQCASGSTKMRFSAPSCHTYEIVSASIKSGGGPFSIFNGHTFPIVFGGATIDSILIGFDPGSQTGVFNDTLHIQFRDDNDGLIRDTLIPLIGNVIPQPPQLSATPKSINFGTKSICTPPRDSIITLRNIGCDTVRLLSGPGPMSSGFTSPMLPLPILVPPDSVVKVRISFAPTAIGTYNANALFTAEANGKSQMLTVALSGAAIGDANSRTIHDSLVIVDTVSACSPLADTLIAFTNKGCDTLRITGGAGFIAPNFSFQQVNFPVLVPPDSTVFFRFFFHPTGIGTFKAKAMFVADRQGAASDLNFDLQGTSDKSKAGPLAVDSSFNFGTVSLCNPDRDTLITFKNRGCDTIRITSGPGILGQEFSFEGLTLPIVLTPDSSITLKLTFHPSSPGQFQASAKFTTNRSGALQIIGVTFRARAISSSSAPVVLNQQYTLDSVSICGGRSDTTVTFMNRGCDTLKILSGPSQLPGGFTSSPVTYPIILPPDSSIEITYHFTPPSPGSFTAYPSYAVERGGIRSQVDLVLHGFGKPGTGEFVLNTDVISFPPMPICSRDSSVIQFGNSGCDTIYISYSGITGDNDFTLGTPPPMLIAPSTSITLPVRFDPIQKGKRSAVYRIIYRDRTGMTRDTVIPMNADVLDGSRSLVLSDTLFDFGTTTACAMPDTILSMRNIGCDTLIITDALLSGQGFVLGNISLPIRLAPGASTSIRIHTVSDTAGKNPRSSGSLALLSNSDSPSTLVTLERKYEYPAAYTLRLEHGSPEVNVLDTIHLAIIADRIPAGVIQIDGRLANDNGDMLELIGYSSPYQMNFDGSKFTITGELASPTPQMIAELQYAVYLSSRNTVSFTFGDLKFNPTDAYFEQCYAYPMAQGASSYTTSFRCGERIIADLLGGTDISIRLRSIRPNPVMNELLLDIESKFEQTAVLRIFDLLGKEILFKPLTLSPSRQNIMLDLVQLPSGMHILEVQGVSGSVRTTFVKER